MRVIMIVTLLVLLAAPGVGAQDDGFYWTSAEASNSLGDSDWAANHNVRTASCRGFGTYRTEFGFAHFKTFRCALRNPTYRLVAHVTLTTSGPETFVLSKLTNRLKVCRWG